MRFLGIDFGERRIGLAISDHDERVAVPLCVLERTSDAGAVSEILRMAEEEGVEGFVVGEPLSLDGERGSAARRVRNFGRRLENASERQVLYVNESLTTNEARARMRQAGVGSRRERGRIDAVAAQVLLEDALAQRRRQTG